MAIQEAKPEGRRVSLPGAAIENEAELDALLAQARSSIQSALKAGPAIFCPMNTLRCLSHFICFRRLN